MSLSFLRCCSRCASILGEALWGQGGRLLKELRAWGSWVSSQYFGVRRLEDLAAFLRKPAVCCGLHIHPAGAFVREQAAASLQQMRCIGEASEEVREALWRSLLGGRCLVQDLLGILGLFEGLQSPWLHSSSVRGRPKP